MSNLAEAKKIVEREINKDWSILDDSLLIIESMTIETSNYWLFFYTSRKWYENNDDRYALAGNSPIFCFKK